MSDELKKALDTAMSRIASLETEVSGYRKRPEAETTPAFDRSGFVADPIGFMQKMKIPQDHITRVLVAHAMGDEAPPHLKVLAQMGPQVNATHALDDKVEALSRQLSALVAGQQSKSARESFKALTKDKTKYPHLAATLESHPDFLDDEELGDGAKMAEVAERHEKRLAKISPQPASEKTADESGQSMQAKPAHAGAISGDPPPLPTQKSGLFTQEEHQKLRDEIVRKFS